MSFWSLFSSPKKRKKKSAKKAPKAKKAAGKEYVIFDKYTEKVIQRLRAKTEAQASKHITSDDHRIMTAARWDKEQKLYGS